MPSPKDPEKYKEWKNNISKSHKGKHYSSRTEFKKGLIPWNRGKHHKPESNEKNRFAHLGNKYHLGKKHSEETKNKLRLKRLGQTPWIKGKRHTEESKRKMSESLKGNIPWNKGTKGVMKAWNKGMSGHLSEVTKKKMSLSHKGKLLTPEHRNKLKIRWQNEEYAKEMGRKFTIKPSTSEKFLIEFLDTHFPNEWKYVGDFKFWIEGRNPDFININGKKAIIEYNGHWKHTKVKDEAKTQHYAKYGFKTLNLYPTDLKNEKNLIQVVSNFITT